MSTAIPPVSLFSPMSEVCTLQSYQTFHLAVRLPQDCYKRILGTAELNGKLEHVITADQTATEYKSVHVTGLSVSSILE